MNYAKKSFCGGVFCNKADRKIKCRICHIHVCSVCSVGNYCIDCYIEKKYKDIKLEFDEMIRDLDNVDKLFNDNHEVVNPNEKKLSCKGHPQT